MSPLPTVASTSSAELSPSEPVAESPAKKRRVLSRSRTGCGTCKGRKKRCDEAWVDGSCLRCQRGGFVCVQESLRPSRAKRAREPSEEEKPIFPRIAKLPPPSPPRPSTSEGAPEQLHHSLHSQFLTLPVAPSAPAPAPVPEPVPPRSSAMEMISPFSSLGREYSVDLSLLDLLGGVDATSSGMEYLPSLIPGPFLDGGRTSAKAFGDTLGAKEGLPPAVALAQQQLPPWPASDPVITYEHDAGPTTLNEIRDFSDEWWNFYNSLNDSYFWSIPKDSREVVKMYMRRELLGNNDLGRAGVSAWCSSHYASILAKDKSPLADEWDDKAGRYYQQTLSLLYSPSSQLWYRIGSILDMRLAQVNRHGAVPAYFLLLAGEAFLHEALGEQPALNFAQSATMADLAVRAFAYADVFRTIALRNRPTFFHLSDIPDPSEPAAPLPIDGGVINRRTLSVHLGLPLHILLCLADTSNAIFDEPNVGPAATRARAHEIDARLRAFEIDVPLARACSGDSSAALISEIASQEMWRHAALIYLHSSLFRLGPLAAVLKKSLTEILQLANSLVEPTPNTPSLFHHASKGCVWFLAATVATHEDERERCREGLMDCGSGKMFTENHQAIEKYWAEVDAKGVSPDWREFTERESLKVCFL